MNVQIEESWKQRLAPEFEKDYFIRLTDFVRAEYRATTIYPPGKLIFNAFNLCPFDKAKVVIIGQDPYHGPRQAHGLCFSVNEGLGHTHTRQRRLDPLGQSGRTPAQRHTDGPRSSSRLAPAQRLGGVHRCGHSRLSRATRASGIHPMGSIRSKKRRIHRQKQAFGTDLCSPVATLCIQWFLWQQALQPSQRIPYRPWRNAH